MTDTKFQTVRAVLRNAVTWGTACGVAAGVLITALGLIGPAPEVDSIVERFGLAFLSGVSWAVRFGIAGAVIGAGFSLVVHVGYRGGQLAEIDPLRFALLGGIVGGVSVPLYLQAMNVLSGGGPIAWGFVSTDAVWGTVFGAAAAAGSILVARRADVLADRPQQERLERGDGFDDLAAGQQEASISRPSGSDAR